MRIGVKRVQTGRFADADALLALMRATADLGFDSFWLGDHVGFPDVLDSAHRGRWRTDPDAPFLESVATMGFLLGAVADLPVGIHALVAPLRHPVLVGKALATLDHLSSGRVRIALCAGWMAEMWPVVGAPPFAQRGTVLEEQVAILRAMWEHGRSAADGEHYGFPSTRLLPRAAGRLPILLGGHGPRALRRAGRLGDGWAAARLPPEVVVKSLAEVRRAATKAGRDPAALQVVVEADLHVGDGLHLGPLTGDAAALAAGLAAYRDAGVTLLLANPEHEDPEAALVDLQVLRDVATAVLGR